MDKETLQKYRAEVIERFINIETLIDVVICQHYFDKVEMKFYLEVLYDEYFTFGLKRRILEKIARDIDCNIIQDLHKLNNIRNYFAHYGQAIFKGREEQKWQVINPRDIEKEINFQQLYSEFVSKVDEVEKYLNNLNGWINCA